jgi:hypothetical protein
MVFHNTNGTEISFIDKVDKSFCVSFKKMEELSWLDTDIIPKYGDFSFINDNLIRECLSFDFKIFEKLGFDALTLHTCWSNHTDKTFSSSIFLITWIRINGWTEFVIRCLNLFL